MNDLTIRETPTNLAELLTMFGLSSDEDFDMESATIEELDTLIMAYMENGRGG